LGRVLKAIVPFLASILLLGACERQQDLGASPNASKLPGVWAARMVMPSGGSIDQTLTIGRDGSYRCAVTFHTRSNGVRKVELQGLFRVESSFLIDTVTNSSQANASVPETNRHQILRIDDKEMILAPEQKPGVSYATNKIVFSRRSK
jgi:hypothetical protein